MLGLADNVRKYIFCTCNDPSGWKKVSISINVKFGRAFEIAVRHQIVVIIKKTRIISNLLVAFAIVEKDQRILDV